MGSLYESLEQILKANPGTNYCASCLAAAGGLRSPDDRIPVARLVRSAYAKVSDRAVETGTCARCSRTDLIVMRYQG
jgi:hypothetical protein